MQTIIRVEKLAKTFNQHQALHAVDPWRRATMRSQ